MSYETQHLVSMLMQNKVLASYYDNRTLWLQVKALRCKPQFQFGIDHGGGSNNLMYGSFPTCLHISARERVHQWDAATVGS